MADIDLLDQEVRLTILGEIKSEENHVRKREQQRRFDVYRFKQDKYILDRLNKEFDKDTVAKMRKIFSLNLSNRIVNEMSSVYKREPDRNFSNERGLSKDENELLENIYNDMRVDVNLDRSNKFLNLHDQCALMVMPDKVRKGMKVRALPPMTYDVIPSRDDPERAFAYILNVWDKDTFEVPTNSEAEPTKLNRFRQNDRQNQKIGDTNDREALLERFIVWTDEVHFTMNGKGEIVSEIMPNPIGRLPFIDVAKEKDFQFFVDRGSSIVDFSLDIALMWTDLANNIRMQGYSQAVLLSEKAPKNMTVGPNNILWLQQDPNAQKDPSFQFISPNPDIMSSLEYIITYVKMFLSSRGQDPKIIASKGEASSFSSGVERLLAMLEKFEATRDDLHLFWDVEQDLFSLIKSWHGVLSTALDDNNEPFLREDLRTTSISSDTHLMVNFHEPESIQTKNEKEQSVFARLDRRLLSRKMALMELEGFDEDKAEEILLAIAKDEDGEITERDSEIDRGEQSETKG